MNRHLANLGVEGAYAQSTLTRNAPKRQGRDSLLNRMDPEEILFKARRAYNHRMADAHPDRGGEIERAKMLGESLAWVKRWAKKRGA